jgi:hypothetical protein
LHGERGCGKSSLLNYLGYETRRRDLKICTIRVELPFAPREADALEAVRQFIAIVLFQMERYKDLPKELADEARELLSRELTYIDERKSRLLAKISGFLGIPALFGLGTEAAAEFAEKHAAIVKKTATVGECVSFLNKLASLFESAGYGQTLFFVDEADKLPLAEVETFLDRLIPILNSTRCHYLFNLHPNFVKGAFRFYLSKAVPIKRVSDRKSFEQIIDRRIKAVLGKARAWTDCIEPSALDLIFRSHGRNLRESIAITRRSFEHAVHTQNEIVEMSHVKNAIGELWFTRGQSKR